MRLIDADALKKSVFKWLPTDPCGREEKEYPFETDICVSMLMEIDEAPTIEQKRDTGEWIEDDDGWDGVLWRCSECAELLCLEDGTPEENEYHFCPFWGADMRGKRNDKDRNVNE